MFRPQLTTIGITLKWFCHSFWDFTLTSPTPKNHHWKKTNGQKKQQNPPSFTDFNPTQPPFFWVESGQIIIFHQPGYYWNKGISLTKPPFRVRSCEVVIIWPGRMYFFCCLLVIFIVFPKTDPFLHLWHHASISSLSHRPHTRANHGWEKTYFTKSLEVRFHQFFPR